MSELKSVGLKMAKASYEEWESVMRFTNELDDKVSGKFGYTKNEELGEWVRKNLPPMLRVVFGYRVLVDNCCDPNADTLEWKTELAALMAAKEAA